MSNVVSTQDILKENQGSEQKYFPRSNPLSLYTRSYGHGFAAGENNPTCTRTRETHTRKPAKPTNPCSSLAGMQEGSSGMNQNEKANIPQFANMAISIKQEPMEIDLSDKNFPAAFMLQSPLDHWT
jgi:hypothetical protein